jgi:hypothetical protein
VQVNIDSAYKHVDLRDVLDKVKSLHGQRLKRPYGSFAICLREMSRIWWQHFDNLRDCERAVLPEVPEAWSTMAVAVPAAKAGTGCGLEAASDAIPDLSEVSFALQKLKGHKAAGVCGP